MVLIPCRSNDNGKSILHLPAYWGTARQSSKDPTHSLCHFFVSSAPLFVKTREAGMGWPEGGRSVSADENDVEKHAEMLWDRDTNNKLRTEKWLFGHTYFAMHSIETGNTQCTIEPRNLERVKRRGRDRYRPSISAITILKHQVWCPTLDSVTSDG